MKVEQDLGRETQAAGRVIAWDLPTRLFKWTLVLCVVAAWATNKYGTDYPYLHKWNGYAILVLLVFRMFWGLVGGSTSRFSAFVTWPWKAVVYALRLAQGRGDHYLGHNPLGGWMILVLMSGLAAQAILGLYAGDQDRLIIEGPLARTISDGAVQRAASFHRLGFKLLLVLVAVHVVANLLYDVFRGEGLILAMLSGRKARARYADASEAAPGGLGLAGLCFASALVVVFCGIVLLGGNPAE